ncbi:ABC transporter permease [Hamadaea tsunoensis]|uniref:ABC transporter permease n=1 Tax=Hamadaea tsunoensis TaxID=53368 RepID=UPI0003FE31EB|nr:ABC transporter permease [Hamadaea tsunoensis]
MSTVLATSAGSGTAYEPPPEPVAGGRRRRWLPYALLLPGFAWLGLFFAAPMVSLFTTSLYDPSGSEETGYQLTWAFGNYWDALDLYHEQFLRSLLYAFIATVACLILGYPLAYAIAVKGGRWKNLMLVGVIAPFFTSFLVRTLAWKTILSDHWIVVGGLKRVFALGDDFHLINTEFSVIAGLTYNFLPFMVLPLYASLEKLDPRLLEAANDLYATPWRTFRQVTLPLSLPGVVSGTLMTFIPAAGDYINAELLGNPKTTMIGNVVQSRFLTIHDYPLAAALSFVLMAGILIMVLIYVRRAGTDEVV